MKRLLPLFFLAVFFSATGQTKPATHLHRQIITKIFKEYVKNEESIDSQEHKDQLTASLKALQVSCSNEDLPILIDIWMYYDATDFPTRSLIDPIFTANKAAALKAISKRLQQKKSWEHSNRAPYSELMELKKELAKK